MKKQVKHLKIFVLAGLLLLTVHSFSQDPNFYIFLCFGQSNMEGQGNRELQDETVDSRFKTFQALDCSNLGRSKETWYAAKPPTCQCSSKLSPADYFGRTMVANLPDSITVGIINVAVSGCDIRLFDKDIYMDYDSTYVQDWFLTRVEDYEWNPYQYLVNLATLAKQDGIIKGILLHQGETNTGQDLWPTYVKKIYNDMLTDLSLNADSVPLLAGEMLSADGNCCASMNTIVNRLHDTIPTAYVISAEGCTGQDDAHFDSDGYREFGRRYAVKMLSLLGQELTIGKGTTSVNMEAECTTVGDNWNIYEDTRASNEAYVTPKSGEENISAAPSDSTGVIYFPFTIDSAGYYSVFARLKSPSEEEDSYWVKIDDGSFDTINGYVSGSWQWVQLVGSEFTEGDHTLAIAYRENGTQIDKVNISDYYYAPSEKGYEADNICEPDITISAINTVETKGSYALEQNYPNPFNSNTSITFTIPDRAYVSLKVFNVLGAEVAELCGKEFYPGKYTAEFDSGKLSEGMYFYTMKTKKFSATRKMILKSE